MTLLAHYVRCIKLFIRSNVFFCFYAMFATVSVIKPCPMYCYITDGSMQKYNSIMYIQKNTHYVLKSMCIMKHNITNLQKIVQSLNILCAYANINFKQTDLSGQFNFLYTST